MIFSARCEAVEDFREGFVAGGGVLVANAELGVVDDRRQDVVEFVRRGADQFAEGGELLGAAELVFEELHLLFEGYSAVWHRIAPLFS